MTGIALPAVPFTLGVDCVSDVSVAELRAMRDHPQTPIRWLAIYLGSGNAVAKRDAAFSLGMPVLLVTFGKAQEHWVPTEGEGKTDGASDVQHLLALGTPPAVSVFTDLENGGGTAAQCSGYLNDRGGVQGAAGYGPSLYVGAGQPLDGVALGKLVQSRYWQGLSRLVAPGAAPGYVVEPSQGWSVRQLPHTTSLCGVEVDVNVMQYDWLGRVPMLWGPGSS